mgnify:CR=1 FL=1
MKRISTVFLIVGIAMFVFGSSYFWYAIQHPTFYLTIPLGLTYAIYLFYFFANIACFVLFGIFRHDENKKLKKRK